MSYYLQLLYNNIKVINEEATLEIIDNDKDVIINNPPLSLYFSDTTSSE